jgi:hypothetical protein
MLTVTSKWEHRKIAKKWKANFKRKTSILVCWELKEIPQYRFVWNLKK